MMKQFDGLNSSTNFESQRIGQAFEDTNPFFSSAEGRLASTTWNKEVINHSLLYKATLNGDWDSAKEIFMKEPRTLEAKITLLDETALHIAVGTGRNIGFVKNLVNFMSNGSMSLMQVDQRGNTPLAIAAIVGNIDAAKILLEKDESLIMVTNTSIYLPFHLAAKFGHKDMLHYLLSLNYHVGKRLFVGSNGARLLNLLIVADFYDIALQILDDNPMLAIEKDKYGVSALDMLAQSPQAFENIESKWVVPVKMKDSYPSTMKRGDVENVIDNNSKNSGNALYHQIMNSIPGITFLKLGNENKLMHKQACELVKRLCEKAMQEDGEIFSSLFRTSLLTAARMGTIEVVKEIIKVYPYSVWFRDEKNHSIFQLAVLHRQEKIFNLFYQMSSHKHFAAAFLDKKDNNILHLAGKLEPSSRISGAALQLQRELQWFQEVERIVQPSFKKKKNKDKKTPRMVFSEEHKLLVKQGENWMKTTATSCTVVAALIATIAFTTVFTVPGGNNDQGIPYFIGHKSFMVFAASDAVALISSSISVIMFLGILTSRYAEDDFLKILPTRMILGLVSLFISIASMVSAFGASLYLVLVHEVKWILFPILIISFFPVIFFAILQFPLLVEMISSTYGKSIFGSQSKEIIY